METDLSSKLKESEKLIEELNEKLSVISNELQNLK